MGPEAKQTWGEGTGHGRESPPQRPREEHRPSPEPSVLWKGKNWPGKSCLPQAQALSGSISSFQTVGHAAESARPPACLYTQSSLSKDPASH